MTALNQWKMAALMRYCEFSWLFHLPGMPQFSISQFARLSFASTALVFSAVSQAQARLGETLEQCTTRYGDPVGKIPSRTNEAGEFAYIFNPSLDFAGIKTPVRVMVEFKNNVACYIRWTGKINEVVTKALRDRSQGESAWDGPDTFKDRSYWKSKGAANHYACQYKLGETQVLELFSEDFVPVLKATAETYTKAILADQNWNPVPKSNQPSASPAPVSSEKIVPSNLDKF